MEHIALLGDSIFDNGRYTEGEPDVASHLRSRIPRDWKATLCAVDGSITTDLLEQLKRTPSDATRLVVSIGGNDALAHQDLLTDHSLSGPGLLGKLSIAADEFVYAYRTAIGGILKLRKWLMVCTIYNGQFDSAVASAARVGLSVFNDIIYQVATEFALPVLELRRVCTEPSDYANPIEPSGKGGAKIADSIYKRLISA